MATLQESRPIMDFITTAREWQGMVSAAHNQTVIIGVLPNAATDAAGNPSLGAARARACPHMYIELVV